MKRDTGALVVRLSECKSKILTYRLYEGGDEVILNSFRIPPRRIVAHGDEYKKLAEDLGESILPSFHEIWEPKKYFSGSPTIEGLVGEIKLRINTLKVDSNSVPAAEKTLVVGHIQKLKEVQGRLRKLLNELDDSKSKNNYKEAWKWVSILPPR